MHAALVRVHAPVPRDDVMTKALIWTQNKLRTSISLPPMDVLSFDNFLRALGRVDLRASPGIPLCYSHPTNGSFLTDGEGNFIRQRVEMLWMMVCQVAEDSPNPIRIFIKLEPHKRAKLLERRYRLISSVALPDQVLDHMIFDAQNDSEVENVHTLPVLVGWAPSNGGWKLIFNHGVGLDRRAWDWTVPSWLINLDKRLRISLAVVHSPQWAELVAMRYRHLFDEPVFQLSDGLRFKQAVGGIMKSGSVLTISSNSHMQLLLHAVCSYEVGEDPNQDFLACGDDTIQAVASQQYVSALRKYADVKDPTPAEFCSMDYSKVGAIEPTNLGKHLFRLSRIADEDLSVALQSYQYTYARSKYLPFFRYCALRVGTDAYVFDEQLSKVFDGE